MDWREQLDKLKVELPEGEPTPPQEEKAKKKQVDPLRVELDKRKGKPATIVSGFEGTEDELKDLAKTLKVRCSAGGSARDGEVLVQGDCRVKIAEILLEMGYKVKRINFR